MNPLLCQLSYAANAKTSPNIPIRPALTRRAHKRVKGFEPSTSSLESLHSAIELHPHRWRILARLARETRSANLGQKPIRLLHPTRPRPAAAPAHRAVGAAAGRFCAFSADRKNAQSAGGFRRAALGAFLLLGTAHRSDQLVESGVAALAGVFVDGHSYIFIERASSKNAIAGARTPRTSHPTSDQPGAGSGPPPS